MSTSQTAAQTKVVVTGAGGFIGHHLVSFLKKQGYWVRGVDIKKPEYSASEADEFLLLDLRNQSAAERATASMQHVYALAADMGGMGYISNHDALILHGNTLINTHTIESARKNGVERYLFTSSACIYPEEKQENANLAPLKESDAYPANPQDAYGWEKLLSERFCQYYQQDYGLETRVARFHNIFGPEGSWTGGREKAPAALCRKIATAKLTGNTEIEIWGDGEQTRSFCYVDDAVLGLYKLMNSDYREPLNIGQDRMVTINELADIIAAAADTSITKKYIPGPQGVRGRNSDNSQLRQTLQWEPEVSLEEGLKQTYQWIESQVQSTLSTED